MADHLIREVLKLKYNPEKVDESIRIHQEVMQIENWIGKLLERYIADVSESFDLYWCSGEIVTGVDFLALGGGRDWKPIQVKNADNSENSSSSKVRKTLKNKGIEVKKWHRTKSKQTTAFLKEFLRSKNTGIFDYPNTLEDRKIDKEIVKKLLDKQTFNLNKAQDLFELYQRLLEDKAGCYTFDTDRSKLKLNGEDVSVRSFKSHLLEEYPEKIAKKDWRYDRLESLVVSRSGGDLKCRGLFQEEAEKKSKDYWFKVCECLGYKEELQATRETCWQEFPDEKVSGSLSEEAFLNWVKELTPNIIL